MFKDGRQGGGRGTGGKTEGHLCHQGVRVAAPGSQHDTADGRGDAGVPDGVFI